MGWASGSGLFSEVIKAVKSELPDEQARVRVYMKLIDAFEDSGWDTQDECRGEDPAYDEALNTLHPTWLKDEGR